MTALSAMSRHARPADQDSLEPLDEIEAMLGACLARPEAEWEQAVAEVCRSHPDQATALRSRFAALQRIGFADQQAAPAEDLALVKALAEREPEAAAALAEAAGVDAASIPGLAPPADRRLGACVGNRYRLLARLGQGAMGTVYHARDEDLGRDVAVKLLDAQRFADARAEARFLQEAELLAKLRHPAVVTLFDRGRSTDGELFLVMDLLEGVPMARVLQEISDGQRDGEPLRTLLGDAIAERSYVRQVVRWTADLADGLAAAHRLGILHRDVKPSNVFLCRDGRAVLLDFGIATRGGDLTAAGTVLGTPWYMAPEQALPGARLTPALDVYALCSCLYHLLAGRPPFDGEPLAVLARIAREDPPRLSGQRPDLARDLHAIVETGMARSPRDRYASAEALAADLRAFLDHRPVRARPLSAAARLWRRARRRPAMVALGAATAVILALATSVWVLHGFEVRRDRRVAKAELEARLPESLAFEGDPEQRLLECVRPEHRQFLMQLDQIVALDPDDLPPRLWRAALHLDEGEHGAAAADLDHVAATSESPYLRAVAARYRGAAHDVRGTKAIDLADLGVEPLTPADCFVAGFHELRNRHVAGFAKRAEGLLAKAADAYPPARDLHLLALLVRGDYEGDAKLFRAAIDESLRLEGFYGRATARTAAVRGAAQAAIGEYVEAIDNLQLALELRPDRHGPWQNLAVAYQKLGDLEKAEDAVERAHRIRPHFWNTAFLRAQILLARSQFALATDAAAALPETGGPGAAWKKPYLLGCIATYELLASMGGAQASDQSQGLADRALREFDLAAQQPGAEQSRIEVRRAVVRAASSGDAEQACKRLLLQASGEDDAFTLHVLARLLPAKGLSATTVESLRYFLARLAQRKAPQDPSKKTLVDDARQRLVRALAADQPDGARK